MEGVIGVPASDRGAAEIVNVAATWVGTEVLGPGKRSVVWVQGCPFKCLGCLSPDWIPHRAATLVDPETLAEELIGDPDITGLTFSGGEPMEQAAGLAAVARLARSRRDLSVLCFTGYRLERLRRYPPNAGVPQLLAEVDLLIDGPYIANRNIGRGLRGSDNQRFHHLTDRLVGDGLDFAECRRRIEITTDGPEALLIGIPPSGFAALFDVAVDRARLPGLRQKIEATQ